MDRLRTLKLEVSGRGRVILLTLAVLLGYWIVVAWVATQMYQSIGLDLRKDAERSAEAVATSLRLKLSMVRSIHDVVEVTHEQIPDPYILSLVATPIATAALDQIDAVVLSATSEELALGTSPGAGTLPPCAPLAQDQHAHHELRAEGLFFSLHLSSAWANVSAICGKVGKARLQRLFDFALAERPLHIRIVNAITGSRLDSGTLNAATLGSEPLATQGVPPHPLQVEVRPQPYAQWGLWWRGFLPLGLVSVFLSGLLVAFGLRALKYIAALEMAATRDGMTHLLNRRYFLERATTELQRQKRQNIPLAMMMVDADHFKRINDTYGHDVGDAVIKHIASSIQHSCRSSDLVARFGGEEFVVLFCPSSTDIKQVATRIYADIGSTSVSTSAGPLSITVSAGLAMALPADITTVDALLKRADQALYAAKAAGRNRLEIDDHTQGADLPGPP